MAWEIVGDTLRLVVLGGLGLAGILTVLLWKKNLATKVTYLRFVVQAVAFTALFYLFSLSLRCSTTSSSSSPSPSSSEGFTAGGSARTAL